MTGTSQFTGQFPGQPPRPEFSRMIDLRAIGNAPVTLAALPQECAALAQRFGLVAIQALTATVSLEPKGRDIAAIGRIQADWVQSCAISGDDLPITIDEPLSLRFVPEDHAHRPDEEVELEADDLDEIPYEGTAFDLGEAVAQSLALSIDPFAAGPNAEKARQKAGLLEEGEAGPFAALAALKKGPPAGRG